MKARVVLDVAGKHVDQVLDGKNADDVINQAKSLVAKHLGWKGLVIQAMSPLAFAQKAVSMYNDSNHTKFDLPQSTEEFLRLGKDLGYVTVIEP